MCGFVGQLSLTPNSDSPFLKEAMDSIHHRGPDDEGVWSDDYFQVGHKRLSIIDLSEGGHQPMCYKHYVLAYNGEVYNYIELRAELVAKGHVFDTESDSEVVLRAYVEWGETCVEKFIGMWAFAIWDSQEKRLFCSRDRFGIKPFYYYNDGENLYFASEVKAILKLTHKKFYTNWQAVVDYWNNGYSRCEETWFKQIFKLMPAHSFSLGLNDQLKVVPNKYWQIDATGVAQTFNPSDIYGVLEDSVKLRLRSDVPVGFHLSGGLDSSAMVMIARKQIDTVQTFTGFFDEAGKYDEREYVDQIAEYDKVLNDRVCIKPEGFRDELSDLIWYMDYPEAGASSYAQYCVNRLMKENGMKVSIGGQGGDEVFGGYYHYLPTFLRTLFKKGKFLRLCEEALFFLLQKPFRSELLGFLFRRKKGSFVPFRAEVLADLNSSTDQNKFESLNEKLKDEMTHYLPALLHVEDRTSMAVSLESRLPVLDFKLVEKVFAIDSECKIVRGNFKAIFKKVLTGLVPDSILWRKNKIGFPTPVGIWFESDLKDWAKQLFSGECRITDTLLDKRYVQTLIDEHSFKRNDNGEQIWKAVITELWLKRFDQWLEK